MHSLVNERCIPAIRARNAAQGIDESAAAFATVDALTQWRCVAGKLSVLLALDVGYGAATRAVVAGVGRWRPGAAPAQRKVHLPRSYLLTD